MTPEELRLSLKTLDNLYLRRESFSNWLAGDNTTSKQYDELKHHIENVFPHFQAIRLDIGYTYTHCLVPD